MLAASRPRVFLSHAWDDDACGRSTHARVRALAFALRDEGVDAWLDDEQMVAGDDLDAKMAAGIDAADAVCVCLTRAYCTKVDAPDSNCRREFALAASVGKRLLPVLFEPTLRDVRTWPPGVVRMTLSRTLWVDASGGGARAGQEEATDEHDDGMAAAARRVREALTARRRAIPETPARPASRAPCRPSQATSAPRPTVRWYI